MISKPALAVIFVLVAALSPHRSWAANVCWVEQVKRTATGIDVYFTDDRSVTLMRPNQPPRVYQTYSARTTTFYQHSGATAVEAVPARLGDRLYSSNVPHDSCSLTVVLQDGKIGLEAEAAAQIGVQPPVTAKRFMPAE